MTINELRRKTDLVPANLRAAARKVRMYDELAANRPNDVVTLESRDAALEVWCALIGVRTPTEARAIAREIADDDD